MSIFSYTSTQGMTKKTPGPLAPPVNSLPSLKMTALSYSWTTLTTKKREKGRKRTIRKIEKHVSSLEHNPGPSSQSELNNVTEDSKNL